MRSSATDAPTAGHGARLTGSLFARHRVSAVVGLVITAVLIWWTVRDVPLEALIGHLERTNVGMLTLAVGIALITVPLRVPRWRSILWQHGGVPSRALFHAIVLGILGNNVLPARTGELIRAYSLSRLWPVRTSTALGSVALERMLDVLAIAALVLLGLIAPAFRSLTSPALRPS